MLSMTLLIVIVIRSNNYIPSASMPSMQGGDERGGQEEDGNR